MISNHHSVNEVYMSSKMEELKTRLTSFEEPHFGQ